MTAGPVLAWSSTARRSSSLVNGTAGAGEWPTPRSSYLISRNRSASRPIIGSQIRAVLQPGLTNTTGVPPPPVSSAQISPSGTGIVNSTGPTYPGPTEAPPSAGGAAGDFV